jgi:hypothetical protein
MSYYLTSLCLQSKITNREDIYRNIPKILAIGSVSYLILMLFLHTHWFSLIIPMDILYTVWKLYPMIQDTRQESSVNTTTKPIYREPMPTKPIAPIISVKLPTPVTPSFDTKYKPNTVEINDTLKYTVHNLGI